ncbi:MAG: hypothetical protein Fur0037_14990 [Planctomycetota bacterium]
MRMLSAMLLLGLAASAGPTKTSFAVLASFEYREGMALPQEVLKLDERIVEITGFMRREVPGSGPVNQFLLINDGCGCSGTPKLNEIVFCALPEGVAMEPKAGIVKVTGKLYVGEVKEDGYVVMLYTMDADSVE